MKAMFKNKKYVLTTALVLLSSVANAVMIISEADIATGAGVGIEGHPQAKSNVCNCNLSPAPIVATTDYAQALPPEAEGQDKANTGSN